jgi:hypothetical protein
MRYYFSCEIEALRSKQRRTDPPHGGELGEANALAGIQEKPGTMYRLVLNN